MKSRTEMQDIMFKCDAFISLFFRDAGSKVTCQAVKCGLPILYTSSGGLPEIVNGNGILVEDYDIIDFRNDVPKLDSEKVIYAANQLKSKFSKKIKHGEEYLKTLHEYFNILRRFVSN